MKKSFLFLQISILLSLGVILSSCVKDEEGYSEFVQNYIDSITTIDEVPVDLDVPCEPMENGLDFYTFEYELTETDCDDNGTNGYNVTAENPDEDLILVLTFKSKPVAGNIYNTEFDFGNPPVNNTGVIITLYIDGESYEANHSDLLYVEKIPGNIYVFSICELRLTEDSDEFICEGNFEAVISQCD